MSLNLQKKMKTPHPPAWLCSIRPLQCTQRTTECIQQARSKHDLDQVDSPSWEGATKRINCWEWNQHWTGKRKWREPESWNLRKEATYFPTLNKKNSYFESTKRDKLHLKMSNKENIKVVEIWTRSWHIYLLGIHMGMTWDWRRQRRWCVRIGGVQVPTAAQATNLSQQVRAAAEASATSVNLQGTDCYFTSAFCVLCKLPLISGLRWNHNEEGIWRQKLQSGSVDTIESHPSRIFWVRLRKAAQRSRA